MFVIILNPLILHFFTITAAAADRVINLEKKESIKKWIVESFLSSYFVLFFK